MSSSEVNRYTGTRASYNSYFYWLAVKYILLLPPALQARSISAPTEPPSPPSVRQTVILRSIFVASGPRLALAKRNADKNKRCRVMSLSAASRSSLSGDNFKLSSDTLKPFPCSFFGGFRVEVWLPLQPANPRQDDTRDYGAMQVSILYTDDYVAQG